jgi:uncharacterized protein YdeI (YjbR/CyaY-like superfamily)
MAAYPDVKPASRKAWRGWLQKHHTDSAGVWLVFAKKHSKLPTVSYDEAVEEALCFGWIDSINKKLGPDSRAQRYTPRRRNSPLSEMNKVRIRRLQADGKMTPAGLAAAPGVLDENFEAPPDILDALRSDDETWRNYQAFPESYQRIRVGWIDGARSRPAVFKQRLAYFLKMTKRNKLFGMVQ